MTGDADPVDLITDEEADTVDLIIDEDADTVDLVTDDWTELALVTTMAYHQLICGHVLFDVTMGLK